jgi:hypothetical protein
VRLHRLEASRRSAVKMRTQTFQQIKALIVTAPADLREQVRSESGRPPRRGGRRSLETFGLLALRISWNSSGWPKVRSIDVVRPWRGWGDGRITVASRLTEIVG